MPKAQTRALVAPRPWGLRRGVFPVEAWQKWEMLHSRRRGQVDTMPPSTHGFLVSSVEERDAGEGLGLHAGKIDSYLIKISS